MDNSSYDSQHGGDPRLGINVNAQTEGVGIPGSCSVKDYLPNNHDTSKMGTFMDHPHSAHVHHGKMKSHNDSNQMDFTDRLLIIKGEATEFDKSLGIDGLEETEKMEKSENGDDDVL